jgi:threonine dehydrogenase-like Zn-dependent dehydrogenase
MGIHQLALVVASRYPPRLRRDLGDLRHVIGVDFIDLPGQELSVRIVGRRTSPGATYPMTVQSKGSFSSCFHTGQTPVLKYNRSLMQAILWDRVPIAKIVNVQVISLEEAPAGYRDFDKGAAKKFVLDPHEELRKAA